MEKEGKLISKAVIIVLFLVLANFGIFSKSVFKSGFTGYSILDNITSTYRDLSLGSRLFFVAQIILVIALLSFALIRDHHLKKKIKDFVVPELKKFNNSETDIDKLYRILQEKKEIRISSIPKAFGVNKELAMEWCQTLESGDLASIDYPTAGSAVLSIKK